MSQEKGSIAVLVAGLLALELTLLLGGASVALSLVAQNRIQGIADAAVLYAHDQARTKDLPSQQKLQLAVQQFLITAESAQQIEVVSANAEVDGKDSKLVLCVRHLDALAGFGPGVICKTAKARSYLAD